MRWVVFATGVAAAVCAPSVGWACNCYEVPVCEAETVVGQVVPADSEGLIWRPTWPVASQEEAEDVLAFERENPDGSFSEVPFVWDEARTLDGQLIAPVGGFEVGERYRTRLRMENLVKACSLANEGGDRTPPVEAEPVEFGVSSPVGSLPLAVDVGPVERGPMSFYNSGACGEMRDAAFVTVRVEESDVVEALGRQVFYELRVDGQKYEYQYNACQPRRPYAALGEDRLEAKVVASCKDLSSALVLDEGVHTIEVRAKLMGTDVLYTSSTFTVDLSCDEPWGGCAQGGGRAPAPFGWLGLGVALGWFVRRRR
jgi:hypothetical protein